MSETAVVTWSLVVPVKLLAQAKSRLSAATGPHRAELALAVAADTVSAALRCDRVGAVFVVTDDPRAAADLAGLGARVVADEPDAGLNPALSHGARAARAAEPAHGVGALSADLPALRPAELGRVLDAAAHAPHAFVADAAGNGTTLYTARPGVAFRPRFGADSAARHRAQGAHELVLSNVPSVRRDVDTLADLRAVLILGAGPRTTEVAAMVPALAGRSAAGPAGPG